MNFWTSFLVAYESILEFQLCFKCAAKVLNRCLKGAHTAAACCRSKYGWVNSILGAVAPKLLPRTRSTHQSEAAPKLPSSCEMMIQHIQSTWATKHLKSYGLRLWTMGWHNSKGHSHENESFLPAKLQ